MKVDGAGSLATNVLRLEMHKGNSQNVKEPAKNQGYKIESPQAATTPPQESDFVPTNIENEQGVIRLLQEGHFEGVADVRLRINSIQAVVKDGVKSILESVGENIDSFLSSDAIAEEVSKSTNNLESGFVDAINQSKEDFLKSDGSPKDFLTGINSAFETLSSGILSLSATLVTKTNEASIDENPPAPPGELEPVFQDFVDKLNSTFTGSLADLTARMDEIKVLPELSSSKGNGGAYEKFLTIYKNMVEIQEA
ncbi:MAG: hypothetical protein NTX36_14895 [Proteobacteria bacterium]|nr:hypothetical protein [Pseudomonadota bacterium]